ncbi:predicted protein [Chaetomium globosum CBS 148.51]|uniref:Uncharacterized protein n=1 Tax=Chaetomium globosum (strain ATCC 6205 / CBS 148.51 / DSM 1962 / NBRC 6347 / NRRL 1970) TaxID=306901 RepID=Q2GPL3_CHAGB|nr:uncharacterized protein CHGG_10091 [Chaetomium globosum CBS 148.51]EAQ83687.1 predicted protein [Chaetomium globosum CBS 148.51]
MVVLPQNGAPCNPAADSLLQAAPCRGCGAPTGDAGPPH